MYRDHRKGPGGPPGGATHPGGPHGPKWGGEPAHSGLVRPLGPPPAPRVGNPRVGGRPTCLGGKVSPRPPPPHADGFQAGAPLGGLYKGGREGSYLQPWAPPSSPATPLSLAEARRSPAEIPATSTTTPSCCWISINLSFPLAGSRRRRRLPNRTCVERRGAVRSALGHR